VNCWMDSVHTEPSKQSNQVHQFPPASAELCALFASLTL
jgi:hypothetical protein